MMFDWNAYQAQIQKTLAELARVSPDILRVYRLLGDAGAKTGHLDAKTRELIALDVAVTVNAGAALIYSTRVLDAVHAKEPTA